MRQRVVQIYKKEGETPFECLFRFRALQPEYKDAILSYMGRLDPMAEGLLLVLVDEENKNRDEYLKLDKTYEIEILFGIATDTGDVLGKITSITKWLGIVFEMKKIFQSFVGTIVLPYPDYSSKPVNGKSLFQWAREGKIGSITVPMKRSEIYYIKYLDQKELLGKEILSKVKDRIEKVNGDFRQEEIIQSWKDKLKNKKDQKFQVIGLEVSCSSGTYMRSLAEAIAERIGTVGLAWKIKRTRVGDLSL